MIKRIWALILFGFLFGVLFVVSEDYFTRYNPQTGRADYVRGYNWSGYNCSGNSSLCTTVIFDYVTIMKGMNSSVAFLNWSNINGVTFPAACPAGTAITQLNTSTTCTSFYQSGSNASLNKVNITASNECLYFGQGGKICGNSTCVSIYSPDGLNVNSTCN